MPLLKRKAFEKSTVSEYLRDDDEVFHCEITDEIFKDYEEYCERIILVNSMVWTCEMTGKNNLTYAEALESEKAARKQLKDFPLELRIPILYLAVQTKRSSFAEMSEDLFNFVRERFFVGEVVEACLEGDQWAEAHVLSVTCQKQLPGSNTIPPASSFIYEVEQFNETDSEGQIGSAPYDRIRRHKGVYTRDKNRLFLKQFVEQGPAGIICIKKAALDKYNISKVSFEQIFTGNPPVFASSKKLMKNSITPNKNSPKPGTSSKFNKSATNVTPDKKGKQESMDKFVKKTDKKDAAPATKPKPTAAESAAKKVQQQELLEKMRKAEDQLRLKKEEEKAKKKEKTAKLQAYLKEWQKVKEDLELEDHKIIPKGTPVEVPGIDPEHFGDVLSILEFIHNFSDLLKVKEFFHHDLDLDTLRKALTMPEHAGLLCDLVQMFLTTIFQLQEDEAEEYNEDGDIQEFNEEETDMNTEIDDNRDMELATKASKWSHTYLGTPLSKLPLDPTTVSEVLRLHLLSSGCLSGSRAAAWRYQQRGGYSRRDDAAAALRRRCPGAAAALAHTHLADLHTGDILQIVQCLMNQLLSYAAFRDVIEEKLEDYKTKKHTLRTMQINERKREIQLIEAKKELRKETAAKKEEQKLKGDAAKALDEELKSKMENMNIESEEKRKEYEKKYKQLQDELFDFASYLGSDRAYRRYYLGRRVPALFSEAGSDPRGPCRDKPAPIHQHRGDRDDVLAYVTKLFDEKERGGSDKENDSGANSRGNSPKKPLTNLNGLSHKLNSLEPATQMYTELMVCTGDINSCYVHGQTDRPRWWVYHTEEQIEALIQSLNKRGLRESELRTALEQDKEQLVEYVKKCPVHMLNPSVAEAPVIHQHWTRRKVQPSLVVPDGVSVAEAVELLLRDHILELEEKIFHGCLGQIKVKDREAWRGTIMLRSYDKQAEYLSWGPNQQFRDDYHLPNGKINERNGAEPDIKVPVNKYRDPGQHLAAGGARPAAVAALASALLQLSQGIHHKYLKRPLGLDEKERKDREAKNKPLDLDALERWQVSLMESRSFAQLVLHLLTLDSSIMWSASILNASCRLCRRKTDPDNMLLCDGCNKGHHLYCLKPKLTKVPEGDWYCEVCKPRPAKERTPRKKRKLFSDDDIEDELNSEDEVTAVCGVCGSGGRMRCACANCAAPLHAECAPRRRALCTHCAAGGRAPSNRRCAAAAITNIHSYTRELNNGSRHSSDSEDSEYNTALVKLKKHKSRGSKDHSPALNGTRKKNRKSKEDSYVRKSKNSLTNGHGDEPKPTSKRRRADMKLHTEALGQLLKEALKHKDCWPFCEPVNVQEVPDYLDIIDVPMDFATVKSKFESDQYTTDQEMLSDIALIFTNCYTYNVDTHPVARSGYRLEKYLQRRCSELELPPMPELIVEDEDTSNKRKNSTDDVDGPRAKKAKLK